MEWGAYADGWTAVEMGVRSLIITHFPGWNPRLYKGNFGWLDGDYPLYEINENLENERRLYLQLADATTMNSRGQVHLRPDWRVRARRFATQSVPLIEYSTTPGVGVPICQFGIMALEIGWALRFKQCVTEVEHSQQLKHAWMAAHQLFGLHYINESISDYLQKPEQDRDTPCYDSIKEFFISPSTTPKSDSIRETESCFDGQLSYYEQCAQDGHPPHLSDRIIPWLVNASPSEKKMIARWWLWVNASQYFSEVLWDKLEAVQLICTGIRRERGSMHFQGGYGFKNQEARIWFGFWSDLCGVSYKICDNPKCKIRFTTTRTDRKYCGKRCRDVVRQAKYDQKQRDEKRRVKAKLQIE